MTQKTVYLSLTVVSNGQYYTLPLTPLLLAMWLMAAFPLMAWQTANAMTYSALSNAMTYSALSFLSATLLTLIMFQILIKSLAWGVRS